MQKTLHLSSFRPTLRLFKNTFKLKRWVGGYGKPRKFPTDGFRIVPTTELLEEEKWPWYTPQSFYLVNIGDVFRSKYQVLYKLGYGTTSTVWMCRDLSSNKYVSMKSMVSDYPSAERELKAQNMLSKAFKFSKSTGRLYVRHALDHFEVCHAGRDFQFLIYEPLGYSLKYFLDVTSGDFIFNYTAHLAFDMLRALDYLHTEAKIVHTDLQKTDILLRIQNPQVLKDAEEFEFTHPSARKVTSQATIVKSYTDLPGEVEDWIGEQSLPTLCDFGEARTGQDSYTGLIQPASFRAPEVFLRLPWSTPVDIWSLGCTIWDTLLQRPLFVRERPTRESNSDVASTDDINHLAQMVALLGPPPAKLLADAGPRALEFFNEEVLSKAKFPTTPLRLFSIRLCNVSNMTWPQNRRKLSFVSCARR
ncbi:kinase-like domain-containing protein [Abortiporus biennis]|nr:kinase-like domain-containing protein [Abortiporus biennis]